MSSVLVDVAIGLILLYLLLALFCTALQEWVAQLFTLRARHLAAAVKVLVAGSEEGNEDSKAVLNHPLVKMLAVEQGQRSGPRDPPYILSKNFVDALVARLVPSGKTLDLKMLEAGIAKVSNTEMQRALMAVVARAAATQNSPDAQLREALGGIATWYDAAMDHASGWYKRKVRWFLLFLALLLAGVTNADSIQVGIHLARSTAMREAVATLAASVAPPDGKANEQLAKLREQLGQRLVEREVLGVFGALPIGWQVCNLTDRITACYPQNGRGAVPTAYPSVLAAYGLKVVGLLLTAILAALGAPFWFGLLQQLNAIRATGPPPASTTAKD